MSVYTLSFPAIAEWNAEPYTGLSGEDDVLEALTKECRKVGEDGGSDLWDAPPSDDELDLYAAREAGRIIPQLWPCAISETARLPDGTRVKLKRED